MGQSCCEVPEQSQAIDSRYRHVLWLALVLNAVMFVVEIAGGIGSGSASLLADAIDFAGDAANYALTLAVLPFGLAWRSRAALVKGFSMAAFGVLILGRAAYGAWSAVPPEPISMSIIGALALAVNVGVAALLYFHREGDANRRSVWLCSRNDALGNVAVLFAALGVFGTGAAWPDLAVASVMALLSLWAAGQVLMQAHGELSALRTG